MKPRPEKTNTDLKVFIASRDVTCSECGRDLGQSAWVTVHGDNQEKKAACLTCSDLDHLVFLPSGDVALTRRARKHSPLFAVVLKWSRSRKRYQRQGLLVENEAIEHAEKECQADAGKREHRRELAAVRRNELDKEYLKAFAVRVREIYPNCPEGREQAIAEHACRKYSGRVGRSAAAKDLAPKAVELAVRAHVRHTETNYDTLLSEGMNRVDARAQVSSQVAVVLAEWKV